jgi:mannosyltransferase OCH1-like enzyme
MYNIPQIIHQTWKNESIPPHLIPLTDSWKHFHPLWEYKLWTDEMNRDFLKENFSEFLTVYDNYPYNIQRVDAVRYFILLKYGGVFVDLDFRCMKNVEPIIDSGNCFFGLECDKHCKHNNKEKIICNAFMACAPNSDFMNEVCESLMENKIDELNNLPSWLQVLEITGPFKLTNIYDGSQYKNQVGLIPSDLLYPLNTKETQELMATSKTTDSMQEKIGNAYAVHYYMGSWWSEHQV